MAVRNSAPRRIPGDPLVGVLRQTARLASRPRRRSAPVAGPQGEVGPQGEQGPAAPGVAALAVAQLVTGVDGVAVWPYDVPDGAPLIVVTPQSATPVVATVAQTDQLSAVIQTWTLQGEPAPGVAVAVAAFEQQPPAA